MSNHLQIPELHSLECHASVFYLNNDLLAEIQSVDHYGIIFLFFKHSCYFHENAVLKERNWYVKRTYPQKQSKKKSLSWCEGDWDSRLTIVYAFTSHLNTKTYFHFWFLVNGDKKLYNTYPFFHPYEVYSPPWHSNRTINDTAVFAKIEIRDVFYPQGHLSGSPNTCRIKLVCVRCKVCTRFV